MNNTIKRQYSTADTLNNIQLELRHDLIKERLLQDKVFTPSFMQNTTDLDM